MDRNRFTWSLSLYYTALFLIMGLQLPFLPLWFESRGLSATEISVILTIPLAVRLGATPAMAYIADRLPARSTAILLYSLATAVLYLGYHLAHGFLAIAFVTALVSIFFNPLMPIIESVAMRGARLYAADYGRIRLWGSLAFIGANIVGGMIVARSGGPGALIAINVAAVLTALAALLLPRRETPVGQPEPVVQQELAVHQDSDAVRERGANGHERISMTELYGLMRQPSFCGVVIGSGLVQASHAFYYVFGTIAWVSQGISPSTIGLFWATGVLVEVGLFAISGRVLARFGVYGLFMAGAGIGVLRWSLMMVEWPVAVYFPIQALHAVTFGATHLATMNYLTETAPDRHASGVQGLHFTVSGVMTGIATLAAGPLYRSYGSGGYAAMAVMALVGAAFLFVSLRRR